MTDEVWANEQSQNELFQHRYSIYFGKNIPFNTHIVCKSLNVWVPGLQHNTTLSSSSALKWDADVTCMFVSVICFYFDTKSISSQVLQCHYQLLSKQV